MILPMAQFVVNAMMWSNIMVALGFGVIFTSLFYFVGGITQSPKLNATAKEELIAVIFSALIIASFAIVNVLANHVAIGIIADSSGVSGGPALTRIQNCYSYANPTEASTANPCLIQSHFDLAYASLDVLWTKLLNMYGTLYLFDILIGFLSTLSFPIGGSPLPFLAMLNLSFQPFDGLVLLVNAHTIVVEAIGQLLTVIWAKQLILILARDTIISVLLPLGILMRAFPWLRVTGSSIIAICLALYFAYPFALLFSNYLIFDVYKPVDFVYSPDQSMISFLEFDDTEKLNESTKQLNERSEHVVEDFSSNSDLVRDLGDCGEFSLGSILCNARNFFSTVWSAFKSFVTTVTHISQFLFSFGGDFIDVLLGRNPIHYGSTVSGLYNFVMEEVVTLSQFIVLVLVTSVIEIIITVTMYRNIALLIGGEVEIIGLTKIV